MRLLLDTQPEVTRTSNVMQLAGSALEVYLRPSKQRPRPRLGAKAVALTGVERTRFLPLRERIRDRYGALAFRG